MLNLIVENLLHGQLALLWIYGLRRVAGPLPVVFHAQLLQLAIVLPPAVALLRALGLLPELDGDWMLIRTQVWTQSLTSASFGTLAVFILFTAGTGLIFLGQELLPLLRGKLGGIRGDRLGDARLTEILGRLQGALDRLPLPRRLGRRVRIERLESDEPIAALHGIVEPVILVSSGMLRRLDDQELEGVVAHELAHAYYGGNFRMLLIWLARSLQALSPAALIAFRGLIELREKACDTLAGRITGKPAALASAVLKLVDAEPGYVAAESRVDAAKRELARRAELYEARTRVRALLDGEEVGTVPRGAFFAIALSLGGVLWLIG